MCNRIVMLSQLSIFFFYLPCKWRINYNRAGLFFQNITIHPRRSLQDVLRCNLCETPTPTMYCDICHTLLCKTCVGSHLLDMSKEHKVLSFNKRRSTRMCPKHSPTICELFYEQCDSRICATFVSSGEDEQHKKSWRLGKDWQQKRRS